MMYVTVPSGCSLRRTASASIPMPIRSSELNISSACCLLRDINLSDFIGVSAVTSKLLLVAHPQRRRTYGFRAYHKYMLEGVTRHADSSETLDSQNDKQFATYKRLPGNE